MDVQLSNMSVALSSVGLCANEEVLVDPSEDIDWLPWLGGRVLDTGNTAEGMIDQ